MHVGCGLAFWPLFTCFHTQLSSISACRGDAYYELLDELLSAVKRRYGNSTLLHLEDMTSETSNRLLGMYRSDFPCLNDDIMVRMERLVGLLGLPPPHCWN